MFLLVWSLIFVMILASLFFLFSKKLANWDDFLASSFECGFSTYYFSRFSFSVHYFLIGLIFLLLDLELCCLIPIFLEEYCNLIFLFYFLLFLVSVILGVFLEWYLKNLDWKN